MLPPHIMITKSSKGKVLGHKIEIWRHKSSFYQKIFTETKTVIGTFLPEKEDRSPESFKRLS